MAEEVDAGAPDGGVEIDQIVERLGWTPRERLQYLLDVFAFEERAHRAPRLDRDS